MLSNTKEDVIYASVLADGMIHVEVPADTESAIKRDYETSDGKTGTKYEWVFTELTGTISKMAFYEGNFGTALQITVTDGEAKPVVLSLGTASSFGEDVMKKLPNIDQSKKVKFAPYSFVDDKGKNKKGMTITQEGNKVLNYFWDVHANKVVHGFPVAPTPKKGKVISSDEWKVYFGQARLFLIDFITEKYNLDAEPEVVEGEKEMGF